MGERAVPSLTTASKGGKVTVLKKKSCTPQSIIFCRCGQLAGLFITKCTSQMVWTWSMATYEITKSDAKGPCNNHEQHKLATRGMLNQGKLPFDTCNFREATT